VNETDIACNELKINVEKAQEELKRTFDDLKAELDRQQTKLSQQIEQSYLKKTIILKKELDQLQSQHKGIQTIINFTTEILQSGHDIELSLNKKTLINRINHLFDQEVIDDLTLSDYKSLRFIDQNWKSFIQSIQQFGLIDEGKYPISPLHSIIQDISQRSTVFAALHKPRSFHIILKDEKGNLIDRCEKRFRIHIKGPIIKPLVNETTR